MTFFFFEIKWYCLTWSFFCSHLNLKLVKILEYQNTKTFLLKYILQISQKNFLINEVKNTIPWTYVINNLNGEEIIGAFHEKELQGTNKNCFRG